MHVLYYLQLLWAQPVVVWELHFKLDKQVTLLEGVTVLGHSFSSNNSDWTCRGTKPPSENTNYFHLIHQNSLSGYSPGSMILPAGYFTTICLPSKCFNVKWNPQSASTRPILWVMCKSLPSLLYVCWKSSKALNLLQENRSDKNQLTNNKPYRW